MRMRSPFRMPNVGVRIIFGCFQDVQLARACGVCLVTYMRTYVSCEILFIICVVLARLKTFPRTRVATNGWQSRLFRRKANDRYGENTRNSSNQICMAIRKAQQPFIIVIAVRFVAWWNVYFAVEHQTKIASPPQLFLIGHWIREIINGATIHTQNDDLFRLFLFGEYFPGLRSAAIGYV